MRGWGDHNLLAMPSQEPIVVWLVFLSHEALWCKKLNTSVLRRRLPDFRVQGPLSILVDDVADDRVSPVRSLSLIYMSIYLFLREYNSLSSRPTSASSLPTVPSPPSFFPPPATLSLRRHASRELAHVGECVEPTGR